jgi:diketogulonate reductase-like aldo/keto reductase
LVREWERELQYCKEHNIAFIPWNPINGGNLHFERSIEKIAQRHKATVQQVALSWLYHHEPNILLIPGTSKVGHIAENVKAVDIILSTEEMNELNNNSDA